MGSEPEQEIGNWIKIELRNKALDRVIAVRIGLRGITFKLLRAS